MIKLAVFDVDGTLVTKGNRRVPASVSYTHLDVYKRP